MEAEKLLSHPFQVNEKVEIKAFEVGFEGSWKTATVVLSDDGCFHVKYDEEVVMEITGLISTRLRPVPPPARCGEMGFTYGLCVDVWKDKAWWEAVVADRLEGSDKRIVFLIDSCTEIRVGIEELRVTQDWDSGTGAWRRRGTWPLIQWVGFGLNGPSLLSDQESGVEIDSAVADEKEEPESTTTTTPYGKENSSWVPVGSDMVSGPEFCPGSVTEYAALGTKRPSESLVTMIRKHLLALGWRIECQRYKTSFRFRYISPDQTLTYLSLRVLCQDLRQPVLEKPPIKPDAVPASSKRRRSLRGRRPEVEAVRNVSSSSSNDEESCETIRWASSPDTVLKQMSKRRRIAAPAKLKAKRKLLTVADDDDDYEAESKKQRKKTPPPKKQRIRLEAGGCSKRKSNFVLSTLIDGKAVRLGAEVSCRSNKGEVKRGVIKRDGINCLCCDESFSLSGFEIHSGSRAHRPAACIFLENGKSLSECCAQILKGKRPTRRRKGAVEEKEEKEEDANDLICSVCRDVGNLLCCDRCPSSFHYTCVGLDKLPDGDWFCPFCCCNICGQIDDEEEEEDGEKKNSKANDLLSCDHCQVKFHDSCLQRNSRRKSSKGKWFCSAECGTVFSKLQQLVGKPVPLRDREGNSLTWTLLKQMEDDSGSSENLSAAIDILHECFEPFKDDFSGTDIVDDLVYSKGSNLRRLNFRRFYTIALQKGDEVVCVANVRILGGKMAELPLVGTRLQYRGKKMCRVLMDELEKQLRRLGVERLILPAAHSVVNMWRDVFGFSELEAEERKKMAADCGGCRFLEFEGTVTCQKLLQ